MPAFQSPTATLRWPKNWEIASGWYVVANNGHGNISAAGGLGRKKRFPRDGYIGQLDEAGSTLDVRVFHDQISDIIWVDPIVDPTSVVHPRIVYKAISMPFKAGWKARLITGLELTAN